MNENIKLTATSRDPMQIVVEALYLLAMLPAAVLFFLMM